MIIISVFYFRHRLLRHTVLVNMIESLSVRAVAQRASKYSPEEQTDNVGDCLVSCEMENLSQVCNILFCSKGPSDCLVS